MQRRDFLRTAGGVTGGAAALAAGSGTVAAQSGGTKPDFGSWLSGSDGGYKDARGQSAVTVSVGASGNGGNFAFSPAGLWVDTGTKVTWEWTGQGGGHNVDSQSGASFSSGSPTSEQGHTFEHTFSAGGISTYQCDPHASLGMKGAIAVGDGVPTVSTGGGGGGTLEPSKMGVPFQAHYVGLATILGVSTSLLFTFFTLKYGESPHASAPNKRD